jgi:very-short-patch-repair endonuclease
MNADDIYRQKVLEGYGYKFLRLNKFNMGDDPIASFDEKITEIVKKKSKTRQF